MDRDTRKRLQEEHHAALAETFATLTKQANGPFPRNELAKASLIALNTTLQDGFGTSRGEYGETVWDRELEGLAAIYARQDVATVLGVQVPLLTLAKQARDAACLCVLLLVYIAYRVT